MELTLDQVREELATIHDQLLALPVDDYAARADLKERQQELRQLSAKLAEGLPLHDRDALLAAFNRLHEVRDRMIAERLSVSGEGAGDAGIDNVFISAINKAIDSGLGLEDVEKRMEQILRQLKSSN
ncbi:MAG: hypothetical protein DWQ40_09255 [Actinobacteria bacterium]|nr:MAG: hypothetical protein DWQ40_09255 [Actinomycetota bacterium]